MSINLEESRKRREISVKEFLDNLTVYRKEDGKLSTKWANGKDFWRLAKEHGLDYESYKDTKRDCMMKAYSVIKNFESQEHLNKQLAADLNDVINNAIMEMFGMDRYAIKNTIHIGVTRASHTFTGSEDSKTVEARMQLMFANYMEALVKSYFADKLTDAKTQLKTSAGRAIDILSTDKDAAKQWLAEHTIQVSFEFPKNDNDAYLADPSIPEDNLEKRDESNKVNNENWIAWFEEFERTCPDAIKDKDYTFKYTSKYEDVWQCRWRPTARIKFDTKLVDAPEAIKKMIANAVATSTENEKSLQEILAGNEVRILGFAIAVVYKLFNGDIHFYKNKESKNFSDALITDYE